MRLDVADIPASADPRAASERLFALALRCGAQKDGALPWHLALHLAHSALADAAPASAPTPAPQSPPEAAPAPASAPPSDAAVIARALSRAVAAHLKDAPSDEQAGRLVGWLVPLLRVDRRHGVDVLGALCAGRSLQTAAGVRGIIGTALLRMLAELDPTAAATDAAAPLLVRDIATIGAFSTVACDCAPEGPGGPAWAAVIQGVFRHLTALAAHGGRASVARWIRLCPSRAALRYIAGLDVVRSDPALLAVLLLHGGPREVAVGLVALSSAEPDALVRAAVAAFVRRAPYLSLRRADWLVDQAARLGGALADLREALLDRLERGDVPDAAVPVTDGLLRPARAGLAAAAVLAGHALAPAQRAAWLEALLAAVAAVFEAPVLGRDDRALAAPDAEWTGAVARALCAAFRASDPRARRALRQRVVRALAAIEADLNRPLPRDLPSALPRDLPSAPPHAGRARALAALALRVARALPTDEDGRSLALALYELALRLRATGPWEGAAADPLWGAAGDGAPDPRDDTQTEALETWLDAWRAADLGLDLVLPDPDVAPVASGHTLGVARLPAAAGAEAQAADAADADDGDDADDGEDERDDEPPSAAPVAPPADAPARPSLLRRLWH
jgi:hypothetical protein